MSVWLPLASLNLRINPFGELAVEDRVAMAVMDCNVWTEWLSADQHALQVVGDCGRGKSTHLFALAKHLKGSQYLYVPPRGRCPAIPQARPLLVDEAQRLPMVKRWQLLRRRGPVVFGTHRDLSRPLARARYAVRTLHLSAANDPDHLARVLNRRIDFARLRPGPVAQITADDAAALSARFGSNIRAAEHYLYHQIQKQAGVGCGQVRLVD